MVVDGIRLKIDPVSRRMGGQVKNGGGTTATVITFTVENLLFTSILTASCWFLSNYFTVLRMPAIVFMFVNIISVLITLHTTVMLLIFSIRHKSVDGAFSDCVLSDVSQGFAVICSLMWVGMLGCMFIDVSRITSVPGFPSSASVASLAVVIGFSVVIPLLALVVTYAAVPAGGRNSLIFNGSTVGAASLLFFVVVSFGSGGVTKCSPYDGAGTSMSFFILVVVYWSLLYIIELAVFFHFSPLMVLWNTLMGNDGQTSAMPLTNGQDFANGSSDSFSISYWRIPGCVLNMVIVISTLGFSQSSVHSTIIVCVVAVAAMHVPLIITINLNGVLMQPVLDDDKMSEMGHGAVYAPGYAPVPPFMANAVNPVDMAPKSHIFGETTFSDPVHNVFTGRRGLIQRPAR